MSPIVLTTIIATFFWGANFVLAVPILHDIPPVWAACLRFGIGTLIMLGYAWWQKENLLPAIREHALIYFLVGAIGIGGFNLLFFSAMTSTSPTNAALIMATNPLLTALMAAAWPGERPARIWLVSIPVALIGVSIVLTGGHPASILQQHLSRGDFLMLVANLAWAGYNILTRQLVPARSNLINTTLLMGSGAIVLLAAAMHQGLPQQFPGLHAMLALAIMASGGTVVAYLLWNHAIQNLGASRTALFMNLIPVFAMLTATFTGSWPNTAQISGGLLVLAGVSISMSAARQPRAVSTD